MILVSDSSVRPTCHSETFQHAVSDSSDKPVLLSVTAEGWVEHTPCGEVGPHQQRSERSPGRQTRAGRLLLIPFFLTPICFHFHLKGQQSQILTVLLSVTAATYSARLQRSDQVHGLMSRCQVQPLIMWM